VDSVKHLAFEFHRLKAFKENDCCSWQHEKEYDIISSILKAFAVMAVTWSKRTRYAI